MVKYAAVIEYSPDKAKVEAARPAHRAYLTKLLEQGKLFASGPYADGSGALIVYEADTPEEADALLGARAARAITAGEKIGWEDLDR